MNFSTVCRCFAKTASITDLPVIAELADQVATKLDSWVVSDTLKPQAADLKDDAQLVADTFLARLPIDVKLVGDR